MPTGKKPNKSKSLLPTRLIWLLQPYLASQSLHVCLRHLRSHSDPGHNPKKNHSSAGRHFYTKSSLRSLCTRCKTSSQDIHPHNLSTVRTRSVSFSDQRRRTCLQNTNSRPNSAEDLRKFRGDDVRKQLSKTSYQCLPRNKKFRFGVFKLLSEREASSRTYGAYASSQV